MPSPTFLACITALLALAHPLATMAQQQQQQTAGPNIRPAVKMEMLLREVVSYPASPIIDVSETISIIPGETLAVRFVEKDGRLLSPRLETSADRRQGCVILECGHKDGSLQVRVTNPYNKTLHYKCAAIEKDTTDAKVKSRKASPIPPGEFRTETYNRREVVMFVRDFTLHEAGETRPDISKKPGPADKTKQNQPPAPAPGPKPAAKDTKP